MIEMLTDMPDGIDGLKAVGKVTKEDYEQVFVPLLDDARRQGRRVRILYQFGPEFHGFTASAAWEDAKVGLRAMRLFDGCAIVADLAWIRELARLVSVMMPCPVKVFGNAQFADAVAWLGSLPEGAAVTYRVLDQTGVIVVEVKEALRAQDFDALALTADAWIEAHGTLNGLVIHARRFPGWENLEGLLRHVRFVKDHHRKIKRIAVATDNALAPYAPRLADLVINAEVKTFKYDDLEQAIAWAESPAARAAQPS